MDSIKFSWLKIERKNVSHPALSHVEAVFSSKVTKYKA